MPCIYHHISETSFLRDLLAVFYLLISRNGYQRYYSYKLKLIEVEPKKTIDKWRLIRFYRYQNVKQMFELFPYIFRRCGQPSIFQISVNGATSLRPLEKMNCNAQIPNVVVDHHFIFVKQKRVQMIQFAFVLLYTYNDGYYSQKMQKPHILEKQIKLITLLKILQGFLFFQNPATVRYRCRLVWS